MFIIILALYCQTEAPLMIRPLLPHMTRSEIHAVMTGGFATIAGGVLAAYIKFGVSCLDYIYAMGLLSIVIITIIVNN